MSSVLILIVNPKLVDPVGGTSALPEYDTNPSNSL